MIRKVRAGPWLRAGRSRLIPGVDRQYLIGWTSCNLLCVKEQIALPVRGPHIVIANDGRTPVRRRSVSKQRQHIAGFGGVAVRVAAEGELDRRSRLHELMQPFDAPGSNLPVRENGSPAVHRLIAFLGCLSCDNYPSADHRLLLRCWPIPCTTSLKCLLDLSDGVLCRMITASHFIFRRYSLHDSKAFTTAPWVRQLARLRSRRVQHPAGLARKPLGNLGRRHRCRTRPRRDPRVCASGTARPAQGGRSC